MVYSADLGEINICVCARVPNPFEVLDAIYHSLLVCLSHRLKCNLRIVHPPSSPSRTSEYLVDTFHLFLIQLGKIINFDYLLFIVGDDDYSRFVF